MRFLIVAVLTAFAVPSFAATPANCDAFIKAIEKAGGKAMPEDGRTFWKGACAKEKDENVTKQTKCLSSAKNDKDAMQCLK